MKKSYKEPNKSDLARELRAKYPEKPTKALARILYNKYPLSFTDEENARTALRYIEGKSGSDNKKYLTDKTMVKDEPRPYNPYNLPASDESIFEPFHIKGFENVGILTDVHLPYHSIPALSCAIKHLKDAKVDAVLLAGDIIDCHRLSRYTKDPTKRNFKLELDTLKAFFDVLEKELKCKIFYKLCNHEIRYENFLYEKAGELVGIEDFEFSNLIKAKQRGIDVIGDKTVMKLNSLNGIHGHEYFGGAIAPVNIARGLYLKGKVSAFQGHNHATSSHTETDMNGKVTTTFSVGCLSELHPAYMPLNRWNHGLARVLLDKNGSDFEFYNHTIYKNKVY